MNEEYTVLCIDESIYLTHISSVIIPLLDELLSSTACIELIRNDLYLYTNCAWIARLMELFREDANSYASLQPYQKSP